MPRPTLPVHFKNFETYTVRLTQTTEDDLKKHYEELCSTYEPYARETMNRLQDALTDLRAENPYVHCNWRKRSPERKYEKGYEWDDISEGKIELMDKYYNLSREMKACVDYFKWDDDWVHAYMYYKEQHKTTIKELQQQLVQLDQQYWKEAKAQWLIEDAEWIAEQQLRKDHLQFHHPKSYYENQMKNDKGAKEWYERRGIPDNEDTCKFCIYEKKQREEFEEKMRKEREDAEREAEERRAEQRRQQEEEEKNRKPVEMKTHHCELCDYKTVHGAVFRIHMESKDHERKAKLKSWYCDKCEHQSRNQMEHDLHLTTKKHKKACGEIQEQTEFHCACCNYTTPIKQNYQIHLKSKKHQENAKTESSVVVPTTE